MHTKNFLLNFKELIEALKGQNFPTAELYNIALQTALKLEELELQERQVAITEEKTRQELELAIINAKMQGKQLFAEVIKSIVQAHSMARSVQDNAMINRANIYTGFGNVIGNASDTNAIKAHADNIVQTISAINADELDPEYVALLKNIRDDVKSLLKKGDGSKEVFIYTPKLEILQNERIKIMGFSSYGNNPTRFLVNGEVFSASENEKNMLFASEQVGKHEVRFEAQNNKGAWIADAILLEVRAIKNTFR